MWWNGNADRYVPKEYVPKEVGTKLPNPWGLFDMHGNVYELCSDWYEEPYARGDKVDPIGPVSGSRHVLRGGSWGSNDMDCRSASRAGIPPDIRGNIMDFRLVRTLSTETIGSPTPLPISTPTPAPTDTPTINPNPTPTPTRANVVPHFPTNAQILGNWRFIATITEGSAVGTQSLWITKFIDSRNFVTLDPILGDHPGTYQYDESTGAIFGSASYSSYNQSFGGAISESMSFKGSVQPNYLMTGTQEGEATAFGITIPYHAIFTAEKE